MGRLYGSQEGDEARHADTPPRRELSYFVKHARQIVGAIEYLGAAPGEMDVLDFGMGWGDWCRLARGFGCRVWGSDVSSARIAHARESAIPVLAWDEIPRRQFDLINIEQVLEHVPAPLEILLHLERGLKPAGLIRIGVPNGRGIKRRLKAWDWTAQSGSGRSLKPVIPLRHLNCFTHDALVRLAAGAGFVPVVIPQRLALSLGEAVACRVTPRLKALFHRGTTLFFKRAR